MVSTGGKAMQTYEEEVEQEHQGGSDVQGLGDGGGAHLGCHHPHLVGGPAAGVEGQLGSWWQTLIWSLT